MIDRNYDWELMTGGTENMITKYHKLSVFHQIHLQVCTFFKITDEILFDFSMVLKNYNSTIHSK